MTFLKSLWRELFKRKMGGYITASEVLRRLNERHPLLAQVSQAYDPSEDPEKILKGEFESYFD